MSVMMLTSNTGEPAETAGTMTGLSVHLLIQAVTLFRLTVWSSAAPEDSQEERGSVRLL